MKYIIIVFLSLLLLCGCSKEKIAKENNKDRVKVEEKLTYEEEISSEEIIEEPIEEIKQEEIKQEVVVKNEVKNNNKEVIKEEITFTQKDKSVIEEIETIEDNVDDLLRSSNASSVGDKAKGVFITLVDFVFYNGEINGVTFDELSESGKEKVLKLVNSIDMKIEDKVPGYKDTISKSVGNAYNKASELIKTGANNINNFAKDKMGDEYQMMIDAKDELVKYTKNALSIVGSVGSNVWDKATGALSDWYQNFKNSN